MNAAQIYPRRVQPVAVTAHDVKIATDRYLPSVSVEQVLDQLASDDAREYLEIATARGDDRLIGQLYREARRSIAEHMALGHLHRGHAFTVATTRERFAGIFAAAVTGRANRAAQ